MVVRYWAVRRLIVYFFKKRVSRDTRHRANYMPLGVYPSWSVRQKLLVAVALLSTYAIFVLNASQHILLVRRHMLPSAGMNRYKLVNAVVCWYMLSCAVAICNMPLVAIDAGVCCS